MTIDYLIGLFVFCLVLSVTPGPNNIMLMASGMNFGVRRTVPHAAGVLFGYPLMVLLVGFGMGQIFQTFPVLLTGLKIASVVYMLWLAWKIATASSQNTGGTDMARPISFMQAVMFQWVNGKAWMMTLATLSAFAIPGQFITTVLAVVVMDLLTGTVSTAI